VRRNIIVAVLAALVLWVAILVSVVLTMSVGTAQGSVCGYASGKTRCLGDISCDCKIQVNEIQKCISQALFSGDVCDSPACVSDGDIAHCDRNCNFDIEINELTQIVNNSLNGCVQPCYSGYNYPVTPQGLFCTHTNFVTTHCGGTRCSRARCRSCP